MATETAVTVDQELDLDFYGIWYADLHHLSNQDLANHWKNHGKAEGRQPNPMALTEKWAWPISPKRWANKLTEVALQTKSEAHQALRVFAQLSLLQGNDLTKHPHLTQPAFDWKFYTSWYTDLKHLNEQQAEAHWKANGFSEKRYGNFTALAKASGLGSVSITDGFDPWGYAKINSDLVLPERQNLYTLAFHYLSQGIEKNRSFYFDPYFYRYMYEDLEQVQGLDSLYTHYRIHGIKEMRFPNLMKYLTGLSGRAVLGHLKKDLKLAAILKKNPHISSADLTQLVITLIKRQPAQRTLLFETKKENADFFADLACFWMDNGDAARARKTFFTSLSILSNTKSLEGIGMHYATSKMNVAAQPFLRAALDAGSVRIDVTEAYLRTLTSLPSFEDVIAVVKQLPTYNAEKQLYLMSDQLWKRINAKNKALAVSDDRDEIKRNVAHYASTVRNAFSLYYNRFSAGQSIRAELNQTNVLIIGDPHIPQCVRYRIHQKIAQFKLEGYGVEYYPWNESNNSLLSAIILSDILLFYRCPATPTLLQTAEKAKSLGKVCIYDIDDLIFTEAYPAPVETYGCSIDEEQYFDLCSSFPLYAEMAKACHFGMASTKPLAELLSSLVLLRKASVQRNALDQLSIIKEKEYQRKKPTIDLFYGSATLAHNSDFTETLLPVLIEILLTRKEVRLILVGHVTLGHLVPQDITKQVKIIPHIPDVSAYLQVLGEADINLAVLDRNPINDAKSEIKWIEAAAMGIPSVVSATKNYQDTIIDHETGLLADSKDEWLTKLLLLIDNPELRKMIGSNANHFVTTHYNEAQMAKSLANTVSQMISEYQGVRDAET